VANENSWPAQALVFRRNIFICGGTLIKRDLIITAAHCVSDSNDSDLQIYLGVYNKSDLNANRVVKRYVDKIIVVCLF
jgi:secreted trypsin-like serine protease